MGSLKALSSTTTLFLPLIMSAVCSEIDRAQNEVRNLTKSVQDEDSALALAHIEMDIRDFDDLANAISYLKKQIEKHSDENLVDHKELEMDYNFLDDLNVKVVHPIHKELMSLKMQIGKFNDSMDNGTLEEINAIVEKAEKFLANGYARLSQAELLEQSWETEEERKKIQSTFSGSVKVEPFKPWRNMSTMLKQKLSMPDLHLPKSYPVQQAAAATGARYNMTAAEKSLYQQIKQFKKTEKEGKVKSKMSIDFELSALNDERPPKIIQFKKDSTASLKPTKNSRGDLQRTDDVITSKVKLSSSQDISSNVSREASWSFVRKQFNIPEDAKDEVTTGDHHAIVEVVLVIFVLIALAGLLASFGCTSPPWRSRLLLPYIQLRPQGGHGGGSVLRRWSPSWKQGVPTWNGKAK